MRVWEKEVDYETDLVFHMVFELWEEKTFAVKQARISLIAIPLFELWVYRSDYSSSSPYHHFLSKKAPFSSLSKSTRPRNGWSSCTRGIQSRSVSHIWSQGTGGKSSWLSMGDRENHAGLISSDLGHDCGCQAFPFLWDEKSWTRTQWSCPRRTGRSIYQCERSFQLHSQRTRERRRAWAMLWCPLLPDLISMSNFVGPRITYL